MEAFYFLRSLVIPTIGKVFEISGVMKDNHNGPMSDLKYMFYSVLFVAVGGIAFLLYSLYL